MSQMKLGAPIVCIVDGYSTGAYYAGEFSRYGFSSVHVQSTEQVPEIYAASYRSDSFASHIVAFDKEETVRQLRALNPAFVIAGAESGIFLADELSSRLNLIGNPSSSSQVRRNKFHMGQSVERAGLPAARQAEVHSVEDARLTCSTWDRWPVVVKPLDSAGSDCVTFCSNLAEVEAAVLKILHKINRLELLNDKALIQERLFGQQYIVNSVSIAGSHYVTEIWQDDRIDVVGAGCIYNREFLVPYEGVVQEELRRYVLEVLDALEVSEGPCHTEVIFTRDGPRLVEVSARLQGGILSEAVIEALGDSHVTHATRRFTDSKDFLKRVSGGYQIRRQIMAVSFIARSSGIVEEEHFTELIETLPSFYRFLSKPKVGRRIEKTVDLFSSPGTVYLIGDSSEQLERDYAQIREWESCGQLMRLSAVL